MKTAGYKPHHIGGVHVLGETLHSVLLSQCLDDSEIQSLQTCGTAALLYAAAVWRFGVDFPVALGQSLIRWFLNHRQECVIARVRRWQGTVLDAIRHQDYLRLHNHLCAALPVCLAGRTNTKYVCGKLLDDGKIFCTRPTDAPIAFRTYSKHKL